MKIMEMTMHLQRPQDVQQAKKVQRLNKTASGDK